VFSTSPSFRYSFVIGVSSWRFYMMVHKGFNSFSKFSSRFFSMKLKHSSSCYLECNLFFHIIGGGIMSFLIIEFMFSWFTCGQEWDILNPSISSLELSWAIFHLKPSLRIVVNYGAYKWSKFFFILPVKWFLPSLFLSNLVPVSGELSPHNFEMSSISPYKAFPFIVGFPTTPLDPSPKDAFSSSFVVEVGIFFSILLFQLSIFYFFRSRSLVVLLFSTHHPIRQRSCFFMPILLTGVLCPFVQVLFILSSLASPFNRSAAWICYSLFPLSYRSAFNFICLHWILFSILFNLSRFVVSLICQWSNLILPLLFLFRFSLRCHSRSRDEILS